MVYVQKDLNEGCEHIFITCERSREFHKYAKCEYLHKKIQITP